MTILFCVYLPELFDQGHFAAKKSFVCLLNVHTLHVILVNLLLRHVFMYTSHVFIYTNDMFPCTLKHHVQVEGD